jgi:hypothetical protein
MNLAEIRDEIRQRLGEDLPNFWRDSYIDRAVNQAAQRFSHEERWTWLLVRCIFDLPVDEHGIEIADDVDYTRQFNLALRPRGDTTDTRLVIPMKVLGSQLQELRARYPISGTPQKYSFDHRVIDSYVLPSPHSDTTRSIGSLLRVYPAADKDYDGDFRYYRNVRKLGTVVAGDFVSDDDGVVDLPIQYHEAIVALATGNLWLRELTGGTKAQEQFNIYNSILEQARRDKAANADDEVQVFGINQEPNRNWMSEGEWLAMQVAEPLGP